MDFYGRNDESALLLDWAEAAEKQAQMTVIVGRRRIGKTTLLHRVFSEPDYTAPVIYCFVAKKSESLLCEEFIDIIKQSLNTDIPGVFQSFADVFKYLLLASTTRHFTLIIDEFQEFFSINNSIYSEMQNLWDSYKARSRLNLVLCGSVYSLMKKIFENAHEPLFQRADHRLHLKPLNLEIQKQILTDHNPHYTKKDLLALYMATGGVPRYIEILMNGKAVTEKKILDTLLAEYSYFLDEGKNVLIEEFGKDYGVYFSALSLIASGKTSRPEIEGTLGQSIGPQLERLEKEFSLLSRQIPIFSKPNTRQIRYIISDNFLRFWFRFIYKYRSAIEIGNFQYVRNIVERDYHTFIGLTLEKFFRERLIATGLYSEIGSYWESGNQNEIDIVAVNDAEKRILIGEVKLQPKKILLQELMAKAVNIANSHKEYKIEYKGFSLEDI